MDVHGIYFENSRMLARETRALELPLHGYARLLHDKLTGCVPLNVLAPTVPGITAQQGGRMQLMFVIGICRVQSTWLGI
jgi:hypothetical protein